jgi:acylpyruvate hydrolase
VSFEFIGVVFWLTLVELVELGLVIGKGGRDISEANAEEYIAGYGVCALCYVDIIKLKHQLLSALAIDMTARNMQEEVKRKGLPWSAVKGFDTFTPIR